MKIFMVPVIFAVLGFSLGENIVASIFGPKINITTTTANLIYVYDGKDINETLSSEESELLRKIFNNKTLYSDNPSCGFTEEVSIRFDDLAFCIACDDCPVVKLGEKVIKISIKDRKTIVQIFEKYGGKFPCV